LTFLPPKGKPNHPTHLPLKTTITPSPASIPGNHHPLPSHPSTIRPTRHPHLSPSACTTLSHPSERIISGRTASTLAPGCTLENPAFPSAEEVCPIIHAEQVCPILPIRAPERGLSHYPTPRPGSDPPERSVQSSTPHPPKRSDRLSQPKLPPDAEDVCPIIHAEQACPILPIRAPERGLSYCPTPRPGSDPPKRSVRSAGEVCPIIHAASAEEVCPILPIRAPETSAEEVCPTSAEEVCPIIHAGSAEVVCPIITTQASPGRRRRLPTDPPKRSVQSSTPNRPVRFCPSEPPKEVCLITPLPAPAVIRRSGLSDYQNPSLPRTPKTSAQESN
jgi:hypothetical protein